MPALGVAIKVIEALIALPKVGEQIRDLINGLTSWWITSQNQHNAHAIADAAAFGLRASTKEERFEASKKWADALSRRAPK